MWDTIARRRIKTVSPELKKWASIFFIEKNSSTSLFKTGNSDFYKDGLSL